MVIVPVRKKDVNGSIKFRAKCDWQGCTREFWCGGHYGGLHFCPQEHQKANKIRRVIEGQKRIRLGEYTPPPSRQYLSTKGGVPRCPECGSVISAEIDCLCP